MRAILFHYWQASKLVQSETFFSFTHIWIQLIHSSDGANAIDLYIRGENVVCMETGLTYDDVLLKPQSSPIDSRSDVDLSADFVHGVELDVPLVSAPMDSVTGARLAQALADAGGIGVVHRAMSSHRVRGAVDSVDGLVAASVGINPSDECGYDANIPSESEPDVLVVDVAHAHLDKAVDRIAQIVGYSDIPIVAGNVATYEGAKALAQAGVDGIKVGVGPGSACSTRIKTGVGVPQFSAVQDASRVTDTYDVTIIADGGIREPGDAMKALAAGADTVMLGGEFAKCEESPGDGEVWGMASKKGKESHEHSTSHVEGVHSGTRSNTTTVEQLTQQYVEGLSSGCSYIGAHTLDEARETASFVRVTGAAHERNGGFAQTE